LPKLPDEALAPIKPYSISSPPTVRDRIELTIKIKGNFTQRCDKLKVGDVVGVTGPYGMFTFDESRTKEAVFIAGGVGVAPIWAMIRYVVEKGLKIPMTLFYSNKTANDIPYQSELEQLSAQKPEFKAVLTVTQEQDAGGWKGEKGRISEQMIIKYADSVQGKMFYLCGSPEMGEAVTNMLLKMGVEMGQIKQERWDA